MRRGPINGFFAVRRKICAVVFGIFFAIPHTEAANLHQHEAKDRSHYAGQHVRDIKSLSAEDIDDLENGRGWGFAKAAELNGMPGPVHLLEFKQKISLSAPQIEAIQQIYDDMKKRAVPLGQELVQQERDLDRAFASGNITADDLTAMLHAISETRRRLRFVHLSAHLKTPSVLSPHQIHLYNQFRGYGPGHQPQH